MRIISTPLPLPEEVIIHDLNDPGNDPETYRLFFEDSDQIMVPVYSEDFLL